MTFNLSIDKLFDNLQKLGPVIIAVEIVTGLILFLPKGALSIVHLENLQQGWLTIIGVIFLLSFFLSIVILFRLILSTFSKHMRPAFTATRIKRQFKKLDPHQKAIIQALLQNDEKNIVLHITDGNAEYLMSCGLLARPAQHATTAYGYNDSVIICAKFIAHPMLLSAFNKDPNFFL